MATDDTLRLALIVLSVTQSICRCASDNRRWWIFFSITVCHTTIHNGCYRLSVSCNFCRFRSFGRSWTRRSCAGRWCGALWWTRWRTWWCRMSTVFYFKFNVEHNFVSINFFTVWGFFFSILFCFRLTMQIFSFCFFFCRRLVFCCRLQNEATNFRVIIEWIEATSNRSGFSVVQTSKTVCRVSVRCIWIDWKRALVHVPVTHLCVLFDKFRHRNFSMCSRMRTHYNVIFASNRCLLSSFETSAFSIRLLLSDFWLMQSQVDRISCIISLNYELDNEQEWVCECARVANEYRWDNNVIMWCQRNAINHHKWQIHFSAADRKISMRQRRISEKIRH